MRFLFLLVVASIVTASFVVQKQRTQSDQLAMTHRVRPPRAEQDYAREAFETTVKLKREIAVQEKEGGLPKE